LTQILLKEAAVEEEGEMGPCVEYFLSNNLFKYFTQMTKLDEPKGISDVIIQIATKIVQKMGASFLCHRNVHRYLKKLMETDKIDNELLCAFFKFVVK